MLGILFIHKISTYDFVKKCGSIPLVFFQFVDSQGSHGTPTKPQWSSSEWEGLKGTWRSPGKPKHWADSADAHKARKATTQMTLSWTARKPFQMCWSVLLVYLSWPGDSALISQSSPSLDCHTRSCSHHPAMNILRPHCSLMLFFCLTLLSL